MLIEPREQILDIWRSTVAYAYRDRTWHWGGRAGTNSICDAEQLLCILYPATNVPALRYDRPDETADDVLGALRGLGEGLDVAKATVQVLTEYMDRYRDADGRPTFAGGSYVVSETPGEPDGGTTSAQADLEIVDSYSMSVTLALSTLGFLQVLRGAIRNTAVLAQMDRLEGLTSERLTAAMTGLLRSFSVHVFDQHSSSGEALLRTINQTGEADRVVADRLSRNLADVRTRLGAELSVGSGRVSEQLENTAHLFECGWSWGVVERADLVPYTVDVAAQRPGVAEDRPYLYFTSVALDGIEDLFSERTRILGLLDETQQRLAQSLQLRWDLALQFWTKVATFGPARWPLEDLPWRTTDGVESEFFSLFVASMLVQRFARQRDGGVGLTRTGLVLEELASRGRITRRPTAGDQAIRLHSPGVRLRLNGSEQLGPKQVWEVSSFAPLLLKRAVQVAGLAPGIEARTRASQLSDVVWTHLLERRLGKGSGDGLWDQPGGLLPLDAPPFDEPSWYHTQRIVECLVATSTMIALPPPPSTRLVELATDLLVEADHLFDQEKLLGTATAGHSIRQSFQSITARLARARDLRDHQPATAVALAQEVLKDLDEMAMARTRTGVYH